MKASNLKNLKSLSLAVAALCAIFFAVSSPAHAWFTDEMLNAKTDLAIQKAEKAAAAAAANKAPAPTDKPVAAPVKK